MHSLQRFAVLIATQVWPEWRTQPEGRQGVAIVSRFEQPDQAFPLVRRQRRMEYQPAAAFLVVGEQRPGIQAQARIGQGEIIQVRFGQVLDAPAKVISEISDHSADEWHIDSVGYSSFAQALQGASYSSEKAVGRFSGQRCQLCQWPGAQKVIASTCGNGSTGVQEDGAGCPMDQGEAFARVFLVGKRVQKTVRHG